MEINNGFYTMNPDKYVAEIKELRESLKTEKYYTAKDFKEDALDIRWEFYGKCYEKAEELGYVKRCDMANAFMDDFDKQAGIVGISNPKEFEELISLTV